MQNSYDHLNPATGPHIAGICSILIAPKEWLEDQLLYDFKSGRILADIWFDNDREFIELTLLPESYEYNEKIKYSKSGSYFSLSLTGITNNLDEKTLQTLNTFRYHQFVAIIKDKQQRKKFLGNKDNGLTFSFTNKETSEKGGTQQITIELSMDAKEPAPYCIDPLPWLDMPVLTAIGIGANEIDCSWPAVNDATDYILQISDDRFFENKLSATHTDTSFNFTGLNPNTSYYIRVKAIATGYQDSYYSNATVTLEAALNIPLTNLWAWWKIDAGNNSSNGLGDILTIADSSPNGRTLTTFMAPSNTYSPRIVEASLNGRPALCVQATGSGASMSTTDNLPDNISSGMMIYIVASQDTAGVIPDTDGAFYGSGSAIELSRFGTANKIKSRMRSSTLVDGIATLTNNTFYSFRNQFNGTVQFLSINNSTIINVSNSDAGNFTPGTFSVFNSPGYGSLGNKRIAEILIYTNNHNATEIGQVEAYLRTKYNHY